LIEVEIRQVAATIHGRVLVVRSGEATGRWLIGFHGYAQSASQFLDSLRSIPGVASWNVASVQGLHRFYHPRTNEVLASWMTREDREAAIADNVAYVDAVIEDLGIHDGDRLVFAGFSQGVAMAYRAGVLGHHRCRAVFAAGGDVPPELIARLDAKWPIVVVCAGTEDTFYGPDRLEKEMALLRSKGVDARPVIFPGAHEWSAGVQAAAGELLREIAGT
jgi:predicted esterase